MSVNDLPTMNRSEWDFIYKNLIDNSHKRVPVITLQKLYEEKYTEPMSIQIKKSTRVEREVKDVPIMSVE